MLRKLLLLFLTAFLGACAILERPTPIPVRSIAALALKMSTRTRTRACARCWRIQRS